MVEKTMEVFMDDFSVFGNSYETCLSRLDNMLQRVLFVAGEGGEYSGRRGIMVELGWNGGERWENVWRGKLGCLIVAGKGGDVTEVGEKRMAGISGLNATVLAIQTGKKTLLLGLWDFDNISPSLLQVWSFVVQEKALGRNGPPT
nr:reverse transcriptase domain-containing protein [Tanacetum cinerariifolium]